MKVDPGPKPQTVKIQPKKPAPVGPVSEHGLGQINPVKPPLPHTVEKATAQIAAAVKAAQARQAAAVSHPPVQVQTPQAQTPGAQTPDPNAGFQSFIDQFYPQQAPPDVNALIQKYLAPLQQMYSQQSGQMTQQLQQQTGFDTSLAQQLGDYLKGIGGSDYTPTVAAALGLEATRNDNYAGFQNQQKLYDTIYGNAPSDIQKLTSDANTAYQNSRPSGNDLLSAFKTYSDLGRQSTLDSANLTHMQNQDNLAAAKFSSDQSIKQAALKQLGQYRNGQLTAKQIDLKLKSQGLTLKQRQDAIKQQNVIRDYNLKVTKFNQSQTDAATKRTQANASMSGKLGFLADASGNPIPNAAGKKQVLPGFRLRNGQVVKVATPRAATRAGTAASDKVNWPNLSKSGVKQLRAGIANSFYGFHGKDPDTGKPKDFTPLSYQEAVNHAVQSGYSRAGAVKMANRFYMPGQRGRPKGP